MKKPVPLENKNVKNSNTELPSLDLIERFLQENKGRTPPEKKDFPQEVVTTNTFLSNFITNSAIPFVKEKHPERITPAYGANNNNVEFDFFTIPARRFLLLNSLKLFVYPQYGEPVGKVPVRFTNQLGDNELYQFSFGFNLIANQINNALLINENYLEQTYVNRDQTLGFYYTLNQNVYTGGNSLPAYSLYGENQRLSVKINWGAFPTALDFPAVGGQSFTGLNVLVYTNGYLLNATDYYRFLDSVVSKNLKGGKES